MKIVIVSGSHRVSSQSDKVAGYVQGEISKLSIEAEVFSLSGNPLPLWDEGVWSGDSKWNEVWGPVAKKLQEADGFVIVAPEWAGMVPAALKNFFLLCSPSEVGHKPALIVAISSGVGGSYPIAELRVSSYKNNRLLYLPEHVIIRNVESVLGEGAPSGERDEAARDRLAYGVRLLSEYAKALASVRASGVIDHKAFPFGM